MFETLFILISFFGGMKAAPGEIVIRGKHPVVVTYPGWPAEPRPVVDAVVTSNGNSGK